MSFHMDAAPGSIAETVLLPGDPLRARYVAEKFLEGAELYNQVRGMLGYTGYYRGHRVSVQGTGMGMPSAMIYAHELVSEYQVKNLVRIGSCGSLLPELGVHSLILAMSACTDSAIIRQRFGELGYAPTASFELLMRAMHAARARDLPVRVGSVFTTDQFYPGGGLDYFRPLAAYGVLCAEMETAGLYTVAAEHGARALSILTVADTVFGGAPESISSDERERGFDRMIELALGVLEQPG